MRRIELERNFIMNKDLTNSHIHRKNILNNKLAIQELKNRFDIPGIEYNGIHYFTNNQIATFLMQILPDVT
ncbi:hypothetical protein DOS67_10510 [Staphylococcus felis]|nr:hypothetical protein DOS67_10510 [Staphylococcus felis]REI02886.1 hypothetical protein DOS62_09375 [Staphylococcus felis]